MALFTHSETGHDAPEVALQHNQLYAMGNEPPLQLSDSAKNPTQKTQAPIATNTSSHTAQPYWKKWWHLVTTGLLTGLIAGLAGGFIGQAIQESQQQSSARTAPSPTLPAFPSNDTSNAPLPGTIGTIAIPQTGCDFPASWTRRRLANETSHSQISYTTICNSAWFEDDIITLWALTPSDCVQACISYNGFGRNDRSCKGAGFIPSWTDRREAEKALNGPPRNCFLKNMTRKIGVNDRERSGIEVVALCLQGECSGVGVS